MVFKSGPEPSGPGKTFRDSDAAHPDNFPPDNIPKLNSLSPIIARESIAMIFVMPPVFQGRHYKNSADQASTAGIG